MKTYKRILLLACSFIFIAIVTHDEIRAQHAVLESTSVWHSQLEQLVPSNPLAYFELAEEIADVASGNEERSLARQLFALSASLDPENLGRSACLALADMSESESDRQRYLALASLIATNDDRKLFDLQSAEETITPHSTLIAVTESLSRYRKGEGAMALEALRQSNALEFLKTNEHVLPDGWKRFEDECKRYRGQLRPTISNNDSVQLLLFEEAILSGEDRSWSADLVLNSGRPLMELNTFNLDETLNVDSTRPYFRTGNWVQHPITNSARSGS